MHFEYKIFKDDFANAGTASSSVKKILKQLNIDISIIKRVVVALYEAEVNAIAHAYGGNIYVEIDPEKINMKVADIGPGIPDLDLAMQAGFSTASQKVRDMGFGAGMGLPNIKNNVDDLKISTKVGEGTEVNMMVLLTPKAE